MFAVPFFRSPTQIAIAAGVTALLTSTVTAPPVPAASGPSLVHRPSSVAHNQPDGTRAPQQTQRAPNPVIAAAGDIACSPADSHFNEGAGLHNYCRQMATSRRLLNPKIDRVLTLGDNQYEGGHPAHFRASYGPSWGRVRAKTSPAIGNHEYRTPGAAGYFGYFGEAAGDPSRGYYSFDIGAWHLVALNSQCSELAPGTGVDGCALGSPQNRWLRADLARHPNRCTLAYWHRPPVFNAGYGDDSAVAALWKALRAADADVVLTGHRHNYARFARVGAVGQRDAAGIRQFVVGTGGKNKGPLSLAPSDTVQARQGDTFGVLKMRLRPTSYRWQFLPVRGATYSDTGTASCN
ncbi:MAG: metallophosphoesterase [Nocardioidaceae bacterium]|nr:metallophosphoesterase [Nocardioidaceae bacterium]